MIKQFLLLLGVIAVILAALLCSLYILDLVKMADLQTDLRKILGLIGVAAVGLTQIGIWLIAYPFAKFAANMIFRAFGGLDHAWFHMMTVQSLILGLIVVAIAQVMEFGHEIEQEKDSFI